MRAFNHPSTDRPTAPAPGQAKRYYSEKNWIDTSALFLEEEMPEHSSGLVNWHVEKSGGNGSEIYTETLSREELEAIVGPVTPFDELFA